MKTNSKTTKAAKVFFGTRLNQQNKQTSSEVHGDFFLYNSLEDEQELHSLLDHQIKQSIDTSTNYED